MRPALKAIVLNTDNSVACQELNRNFSVGTIDLADLRTGLQFYADTKARSAFAARVAVNSSSPAVHLLGSGDFHHLTLMLLEQMANPFLLVVFDNHTDCSYLGPKYHCGNWLYHAALLPGCRMVLHGGATANEGLVSRCTGVRSLIRNGKLRQIAGRELVDGDSVQKFVHLLAAHNPERIPVYVSVDKDVLRQEESPGDWDNGVMSLLQLRGVLDHVKRIYPLAGVDITGEKGGTFYYPYRPVKNILSWIEHRDCRDATPFATAVGKQQAINRALLEVLGVERVD